MPEKNEPAERRLTVRLLDDLIRLYQLVVSPLLGPSCRYHPTCSSYARHALVRHGALKGLVLAVFRIGRCHPWGGDKWHDPVPDQFAWPDVFRYKRPHDGARARDIERLPACGCDKTHTTD